MLKTGLRHRVMGTAWLAAVLLLPAAVNAGQPAVVDVQAEAPAAAIDEVVVVAHKHARALHDVAASVSVFSGKNLRFELGDTVADVFRYAPGIDYEAAGSRFGSESINIRGISGNRVAILVDGVPVSDQFDVGSFSNATRDLVNAGFIDQIEVLHGPASALYGSAAIGGVVAMSTVDPRSLTGGQGQGGRFTTGWRDENTSVNATAVQAFAGDRVAMLAGVSMTDGNEFDAAAASDSLDWRDFTSRSALLKLTIDDARGNRWQATAHHRESDVESELGSVLGTGRYRSTTALVGNDEAIADLLSLEYHFGNDSGVIDDGVVRAYYQDSEIVQHTLDERGLASRPVSIDRLFSFEQQTSGIEANLQKSVTIAGLPQQLGFGADFRDRDTAEYRDGLETGIDDGAVTNVLLGEVFPLRDFPLSRTRELGAYLEDVVTIGRLSLIAAVRADSYDMQPSVDAMYAEDYPFAVPVSISESEVSPKFGVIYRFGESAEIYAQYSHGFRAPPYEDANISLELPLFNFRAVPNPDLRSEKSDGLDVGLRWRGDGSSARLSLFRSDYEDFIESKVRIGPDPVSGRILFQSQNIERAVIEGIEAGGTLALDALRDGLSIDASLFVARGENRDNGEPLNSVGPPQGVLSLNWASAGDRFRTSLRGTFTDDWSERDERNGELFKPAGYAVFDAFMAYRLGARLTLRAALMNLTDRTYWSWTDVRGLAPGDPVIPYLSRPGRSFNIGLDMHW